MRWGRGPRYLKSSKPLPHKIPFRVTANDGMEITLNFASLYYAQCQSLFYSRLCHPGACTCVCVSAGHPSIAVEATAQVAEKNIVISKVLFSPRANHPATSSVQQRPANSKRSPHDFGYYHFSKNILIIATTIFTFYFVFAL